jgi:hypothetical protein
MLRLEHAACVFTKLREGPDRTNGLSTCVVLYLHKLRLCSREPASCKVKLLSFGAVVWCRVDCVVHLR